MHEVTSATATELGCRMSDNLTFSDRLSPALQAVLPDLLDEPYAETRALLYAF